MSEVEDGDYLFRREAGRMVATLTRIFGIHNLALAEDVVQDAFCRALEVWKFRGVPDNPAAWLMAAAKNRAIDTLRRERTARTFAPELGWLLETEWTLAPVVEQLFEPNAIQDDQLRMMFSCCHPRLREEVQVALVLHILCGFSVGEIAGAFLSTEAAIEKRISRGKHVLAESKRLFDVNDATSLAKRLPAVQRALYLLFNEGYHGASRESSVRSELCEEAMRLVALLQQHERAATPATHALSAMMALHAARLPGRLDADGNLSPLYQQDRSQWDRQLIEHGLRAMERSATGVELTAYHVEAAIAAIHATASSTEATDWGGIVSLYETLMAIQPSPVVALNRAIAIAQHAGAEQGLDAIRAIEDTDRLAAYPFYPAALGELELRCGRSAQARQHFRVAAQLSRSAMERRFYEARLATCDAHGGASTKVKGCEV